MSQHIHLSILRRKAVEERVGRGRSSLYSDIKSGLFMNPVALGPRAVGWPTHEVDLILAARIACKSEDEIRALVKQLENARTAAA